MSEIDKRTIHSPDVEYGELINRIDQGLELNKQMIAEVKKANDTQVGGGHYKALQPEPWDMIWDWGVDYLVGNAIKYIARHRGKNKKQDIEKAIHYIDKRLEKPCVDVGYVNWDSVALTFQKWSLGYYEEAAIDALVNTGRTKFERYSTARHNLEMLLRDYDKLYPEEDLGAQPDSRYTNQG